MSSWFDFVKARMKESKDRKLCEYCHKQRLTPSASSKGVTMCATCTRRRGEGRIKHHIIPKGFRRDKK